MALVVHHYFPLGSTNLGDGLVARALRASVRRHFGPCEFVDFPANDRYPSDLPVVGLRGDNLRRSNSEADLVLIGGSNLLEARKPRRRKWFSPAIGGWGVVTDEASIEALQTPLMLLGMGTGSSFGKRIRPYHRPAVDEIRLLHRKAFVSAVRDQVTVEKLRDIGIQSECTGCPVTFLTDRPVEFVEDRSLPLLVSFPPPRIVERPGGQWFMREAMRYLQWLRGVGMPFIVTLHDLEDVEPARKWVPKGIEVFCTANLDELIARVEASCGIIGFRLHAALLGVGLGKPVIPIGVDWRGIGFIKTFGLDDLSIRALRPMQFSQLRRLTHQLLERDRTLVGRLDEAKKTFQARYESMLTRALARFSSLAPRNPVNV